MPGDALDVVALDLDRLAVHAAAGGTEAAQLLRNLQEGGAQLIACQMSMDVMGIRHEEMIDGVEIGGVAAFLEEAHQSAVTLFI